MHKIGHIVLTQAYIYVIFRLSLFDSFLLTLKIRYILRKIGKKKYSEEKYHEQTAKKNEQELDDFTEDFKA